MKIGILHISDTLIDGLKIGQNLDVLKALYSEFYPIEMQHDAFKRAYIVLGYCDKFDDFDMVEKVNYPEYECMMKNENGTIKISFSKK